MDRRTIIIAVLFVLVLVSLCSVRKKRNETYAPGSVDPKPLVKKYIEDNADVLSEKPLSCTVSSNNSPKMKNF